jgi:hypothetical protein
VSAQAGEGPTVAEASAAVTAAAPKLIRVPGKILRPATGVLRAGSVRLGLWMTDCASAGRVRQTCFLPPRLFAGEGLGMEGAGPSTEPNLTHSNLEGYQGSATEPGRPRGIRIIPRDDLAAGRPTR